MRVPLLFEVKETVEVLFDDNVTEIHRYGAYEVELLFIPQFLSNIPYTMLQGMIAAYFVAGPTTASVNGIEVSRYGMAVFTKRANDDMRLHQASLTPNLVKNCSDIFHLGPIFHP